MQLAKPDPVAPDPVAPFDSPSGQFASFVKAEYDKWGKVVKKSGIYHGQ